MNRAFWRGRRVFLTGHTGFKGTWLTRWLTMLGADVTGYSIDDGGRADARGARLKPDLRFDDVRDLARLRAAMSEAAPEIVVHLAAQALVRASYDEPVTTFTTNVTGTVHVLEAIRSLPSVRVAVMATSDKSYANSGAGRAFTEDDPLGGNDPYSSSKACAELVITSYRASFFRGEDAPRIVSVRAGNVIGGGDWAKDRLVPDLVRAFRAGTPAAIRYPDATRPWQFVLDALHGYLRAAEYAWERGDLPETFNFGPDPREARSVRWLADTMAARWGGGAAWHVTGGVHPHEEPLLALDSARARQWLQWKPLLGAESVVAWTTDWYKSARDLTVEQIEQFMELIPA
ncbi:MAG TPA: CDP-glucose 4,6-dehydratase [Thermoanaerobaculia bacterium]